MIGVEEFLVRCGERGLRLSMKSLRGMNGQKRKFLR
jgi:hypothetical protein